MFSKVVRCRQTTPDGARLLRHFSSSTPRQMDYTHVVIGGGVVGLAVSRALAARAGSRTLLLERHSAVGTETSSRNSEVVHAGIYYDEGSLKTKLCVRGRRLLYDFCRTHSVGHRTTGKWIVAQDRSEREALERIYEHANQPAVGVPLRWVGAEEAQRREPAVRAAAGVLESPETGIVDSHGLMLALQGHFEERGGDVALLSRVVGVEPLAQGTGWALTVQSHDETITVTTETVVNAAGLGAVDLHNMIVPQDRQLGIFYAKGNYFSYGASRPHVGTLIYPAPRPGGAGLGTHLTLDMAGRVRFGPDVEWVESPENLAVNSARLPEAIAEIKKYLPGVDEQALTPDYAGIRPKLGKRGAGVAGSGFVDFVVREEDGFKGWVNLLGIESPGLTSCLAIAEEVDRLLYG